MWRAPGRWALRTRKGAGFHVQEKEGPPHACEGRGRLRRRSPPRCARASPLARHGAADRAQEGEPEAHGQDALDGALRKGCVCREARPLASGVLRDVRRRRREGGREKKARPRAGLKGIHRLGGRHGLAYRRQEQGLRDRRRAATLRSVLGSGLRRHAAALLVGGSGPHVRGLWR